MDNKIKNAMMNGSMSVWTKEERARREEARSDPNEAREKMETHTKELQRTYKKQKADMDERVRAIPQISVRSKEDWDRLQVLRRDPEEAVAETQKQYKETARKSVIATLAMNQNLALKEQFTFWSQAEQERIEEHRQDPEEAQQKMEQRVRETQQKFREEQKGMHERVWNMQPLNIRSKEESEIIEEARRDPKEASARMEEHIHAVSQKWKERKGGIYERVRALPQLSLRTPAERKQIEERRQDPDEAKAKMSQHLRELAKDYKAKMNAITDRVDALPARTFRPKHEVALVEERRKARHANL